MMTKEIMPFALEENIRDNYKRVCADDKMGAGMVFGRGATQRRQSNNRARANESARSCLLLAGI